MAWRIFLSRIVIVQIRIGNYSEGYLDNMAKVIFSQSSRTAICNSFFKNSAKQIKEHFKNLYRFSKGNKYSCIFSKKGVNIASLGGGAYTYRAESIRHIYTMGIQNYLFPSRT